VTQIKIILIRLIISLTHTVSASLKIARLLCCVLKKSAKKAGPKKAAKDSKKGSKKGGKKVFPEPVLPLS